MKLCLLTNERPLQFLSLAASRSLTAAMLEKFIDNDVMGFERVLRA